MNSPRQDFQGHAAPTDDGMNALCADLLAEYEALATLVIGLTPEQWQTRTAFYDWTPWDEIAHLCYFDEMGLMAITDAAAFADNARQLMQAVGKGQEFSAIAREKYGHLAGPALLDYWCGKFRAEVAALAALDVKARLPWYGPPMSARSFATARLMETWAHGQDVYDMLRQRRPVGPGLRHIAHLGVGTYGWSFANRGLPAPKPPPHVELKAPNGELWRWNEPSASDYVKGSAEDFCLLVTQRRHLTDTGLTHAGAAACEWLAIAQCFAGPPADGPAPGRRKVAY